ncbi:unnamed protein product [Caenorhabditis brenneri]
MAKRARLTATPPAMMEDEAPQFPLFRLPQKEILRTIRLMRIDFILIFSLISKRCKNLAASIKWKGLTVHATICEIVKIHLVIKREIFRLEYRTVDWNVPKSINERKLTAPFEMTTCFKTKWDWNNNFEMKDWVQHFLTVFSRKNVDELHLTEESTQFNLEHLKEIFGRPTELSVEKTPNHEYNQLMLQTFLPVDRLEIYIQIFENSKIPPEILNRNFSNLSIVSLEYGLNLNLDVLLMAKAKSLHFRGFYFAELDFNKFIKRWMRHGANPELEYLCLTNPQFENKNDLTIMRRIWHEQVPLTETRRFKTVGYDNPLEVRGGNDIWRREDRMKATIVVEDVGIYHYWQMFVWKEHCVVEDAHLD